MPTAQRERIQMVLLRESGMTQSAIAEAMGVSLSTVNRAHMAIDGGGIKALIGHPCRRVSLFASSDDRDWVTFSSLAFPSIVVGRWGRNHMARVRFEKAILEAQCDVEIAPGVVLSAGRHTAVLRQQIIISTLSGPGRGPPRYLLDMNEISYDVTDLVIQKRLRPTA